MTTKIGTVSPVALRDVWPKEDADFTPWLTANIGELDRELGIGLQNARSEQSAGTFRVDIVADTDGGSLAIENQYGRSDHKHFGQLLTYIAHPDQEISQGIWIVEEARDEHVKAVERLNEAEKLRIWMVEAKAIRIEDSLPAPVFEVVVAPPEDSDRSDVPTTGEAVGSLKPSQIKIREFQQALFAQAEKENLDSPFKGLRPSVNQVRDTKAQYPGLLYRLAVKHGEARIVVTNRKPKGKSGTWLRAYDELRAQSAEIAHEFATAGPSGSLTWWDTRPENGRWGVTYSVDVRLDDPEKERLRELNKAAAAMKAVFGPRIDQLADNLEDAPLKPSRKQGRGDARAGPSDGGV